MIALNCQEAHEIVLAKSCGAPGLRHSKGIHRIDALGRADAHDLSPFETSTYDFRETCAAG
jgi:hypothetical protein